jgi:hypothetical protein
MTYIDNFSTDRFTSGDYTLDLGSPPPASVVPHAMTVLGTSYVRWLDERSVLTVPFSCEMDVLAMPLAPTLIAVGVATPDILNGIDVGFASGSFIANVNDQADTGDLVSGTTAMTWPTGDITLAVSLAADGSYVASLGVNTFTATVAPALMAALAARTLYPFGYIVGDSLSGHDVVASEWRHSEAAPPPPPPAAVGSIVAGPHLTGFRPSRGR